MYPSYRNVVQGSLLNGPTWSRDWDPGLGNNIFADTPLAARSMLEQTECYPNAIGLKPGWEGVPEFMQL